MGFLEDLSGVLQAAYDNPGLYIFLAFLYAIAVAVVLPIPIEVALLLPLLQHRFGYLAGITIALAAGKTIGAWLIFLLGVNVEGTIRSWAQRWKFAAWFVEKAEVFVRKTGNLGIYILLSIPGMTDTIPLYLYSLFNEGGQALDRRMYLIANFLAALNRVSLLVVLFVLLGVDLFHL